MERVSESWVATPYMIYLQAVFGIVMHFKVRRRTKRLLQRLNLRTLCVVLASLRVAEVRQHVEALTHFW